MSFYRIAGCWLVAMPMANRRSRKGQRQQRSNPHSGPQPGFRSLAWRIRRCWRVQTQRQQIQADLQQKRELIKRLNARLQELNQLGDEDIDEDDSDEEDGLNGESEANAAASYAHLELLTYLLSKGGNINIPDDDGETPLFVVETLDAAKFLIEHGAEAGWKNEEGLTVSNRISIWILKL